MMMMKPTCSRVRQGPSALHDGDDDNVDADDDIDNCDDDDDDDNGIVDNNEADLFKSKTRPFGPTPAFALTSSWILAP